MHFVSPVFLWALLALAIPIVIHLFSFRRFKTVYFSNVRFLKEVKEETASRSKLKHLVVLALRLLAIFFLVMAFVQPYLPASNTAFDTGKKYLSIYIDNSFSMNSTANGRTLFERAKLAAKEIAGMYGTADEFQLLANDFSGKYQRLVSREEFLTMLDELELSSATRNMQEVSRRQADALNLSNSPNKVSYILSDFQRSSGVFVPDTTIRYNLLPLTAAEEANVYIDTAWFLEPVQLVNQPVNLIYRVQNSGNKAAEACRVVLKLNNETKLMTELNMDEGESLTDTFTFVMTSAGNNRIELTLSDFPVTFDNEYYLTCQTVAKLKVLSVNSGTGSRFIQALFGNQPEFDFVSVNESTVTPEALRSCRLLVVEGVKNISSSLSAALGNYVQEGGSLVLFPAADADLASYNRFLNTMQAATISGINDLPTEVTGINVQQNVFKGVFEKVPENISLPKVKKHFTASTGGTLGEEPILTLRGGASLVSRYAVKKGFFYMSMVPLSTEYSELPVHAVFVPMLYQMAALQAASNLSAYFIGGKQKPELPAASAAEKVYRLRSKEADFIPEQFSVGDKTILSIGEQVKKSGFYEVTDNNNNTLTAIALNYNRNESQLSFYSADELAENMPYPNVKVVNAANTESAALLKELDNGTPLWKWCILLTLLFLAAEILALRFWKTAA